jgi:2-keto-myo-inositol isomerase
MVAPGKNHAAFFDLAGTLGLDAVEIRNDLPGVAILDATPPAAIRQDAQRRNLTILSINALQRFNQWSPARDAEARALCAFAAGCGAEALVLCPVNDHAFTPSEGQRLAGLERALAGLRPILEEAGLIGLVEPLGFAECSLRLKSEAVAAIDAVGAAPVFRLVHDTFHHFVAGEEALFPERTGLVHVSGVANPAVAAGEMRDPDRVLVDGADRLGNVAQLRALLRGGYGGALSFEPFSPKVHASPDIVADLRASIRILTQALERPAAD